MSFIAQSFLSTQSLSLEKIEELFTLSKKIKNQFLHERGPFLAEWGDELRNKVVLLAFFEPSTRTQMSFVMACQRLQMRSITFPAKEESSLSKGETYSDTFLNLGAMQPDLFVVRSSSLSAFKEGLDSCPIPLINAGSGVDGHPTQALLDAFTIKERLGRVEGQKILFVGDVVHSRVASSNRELLQTLGAQIGVCGPEQMLPKDKNWCEAKVFHDLNEALQWATVCMGLRVQLERHASQKTFSTESYAVNFCLNKERLKHLTENGVILHPGPFVRNLDFHPEVLKDKRCAILEQVNHGVFVRAALMAKILIKGISQ